MGIMICLTIWMICALIYKFIFFRKNQNLILKSVKIDNHKVFNEFLKVYLECVAWLITPSALIFMKLYIICNVYQFFIAGFVLIGFFYFINLSLFLISLFLSVL